MKNSILLFQVILLVFSSSIAIAAEKDPSSILRSAIKKGRTINEKSDVNISGRLLSGLILVDDSIESPLMITNISKLVVNQGSTTFGAGGCFIIAKFSGIKQETPVIDILRISCIDNAGYAYEFANEAPPFLGSVSPKGGNALKLGTDIKGRKTIEAGTDVSIKLNQQLKSSKIAMNLSNLPDNIGK